MKIIKEANKMFASFHVETLHATSFIKNAKDIETETLYETSLPGKVFTRQGIEQERFQAVYTKAAKFL